MPMLDYMKDKNEQGKVFYAYGDIDVPISGTRYFLFVVGASQVDLGSVVINGISGTGRIAISRDATITDSGTPFVSKNYNIAKDTISKCTLNNSTVTASDEGQEMISYRFFLIDPSGQGRTPDTARELTDENSSWILPANNSYLIKIENTDTSNAMSLNFKIIWTELD